MKKAIAAAVLATGGLAAFVVTKPEPVVPSETQTVAVTSSIGMPVPAYVAVDYPPVKGFRDADVVVLMIGGSTDRCINVRRWSSLNIERCYRESLFRHKDKSDRLALPIPRDANGDQWIEIRIEDGAPVIPRMRVKDLARVHEGPLHEARLATNGRGRAVGK